jgi:hypothetical protein
MIPKVQCCIRCLSQGVTAAHIIDGRSKHSILMELLTDEVGCCCCAPPACWSSSSLTDMLPVVTEQPHMQLIIAWRLHFGSLIGNLIGKESNQWSLALKQQWGVISGYGGVSSRGMVGCHLGVWWGVISGYGGVSSRGMVGCHHCSQGLHVVFDTYLYQQISWENDIMGAGWWSAESRNRRA